MAFKHGSKGEIWLNGVDVSGYFNSADFSVKTDTASVDAFKATYHSYLAGNSEAMLAASGYYDSADADKVRDSVSSQTVGQLTYSPAGALAIGDLCRLLNINTTDYKTSSLIAGAVAMDWSVMATAPVGMGNCLHILQSESPATVTGTGSDLGTGASSATGLIAHLHVTAMTGGDTHTFKLQDATTLGGAYTDIASGAFVNVTAVGSQRLVVPGTIRAFVRMVAVISTHAATYACAAART